MEYIRVFQSQQDAEQQLAQITHPTLSAIRGGGFIGLNPGGSPVPPGPDPSEPFYVEDISGRANTLKIKKDHNNAPTLTIEKSTDGTTWETMDPTSTSYITATIPANGRLYLRCNTTTWGKYASNSDYCNNMTTSEYCNIGGNIMSLIYGSAFTGNETTFKNQDGDAFYNIFSSCPVVNAKNLLLPATTVYVYGYRRMFGACTHLITAPALPAMNLGGGAYQEMFFNCRELKVAPELPAVNLPTNCYQNMFEGCTSLTEAPELRAATINRFSYYNMFKSCTNLNYVKCLATNISASNCVTEWLLNVAATGTFVKATGVTWNTGVSGIPSGWTVQEE